MMDDQKILDSTPAGNYTNVSMSNGKPFIWTCNNFRSLADIKEIVELRKANAELKDGLAFCLPYAEWALQGQMFNKGIIEAKKLLENHGQTKALKAGN
jgi:hypothetical protein